MRAMPGFTLKSLKAHYALVPLFGVTVMGFCGAMYYLTRLATRCPEVGSPSVMYMSMSLLPTALVGVYSIPGNAVFTVPFLVSWRNPTIKTPKEHWQRYKPTDQYKFYSPSRDYSKERFPPERPKLD